MPKISAVIITLNEEGNIRRAILSVKPWADEIIVVDMMSDDRTADEARAMGAKLFEHPRVGFVEPARATAVAYASGDWIFILDADEIASLALSRELRRIAESDAADVCRLPRLNYIMGRPMLHGQHAPDRDIQVRFFKNNYLRFSDRIHSYPEAVPGARMHTIRFHENCAIHHFHAATAYQLVDKMNRYTTTEAEQVFREGRSSGAWRLLLIPPLFFLRGYLSNQGWRDGWRGFYWACLMAFYRLTREIKHLQLSECNGAVSHDSIYSQEITRLLIEHDKEPNQLGFAPDGSTGKEHQSAV